MDTGILIVVGLVALLFFIGLFVNAAGCSKKGPSNNERP